MKIPNKKEIEQKNVLLGLLSKAEDVNTAEEK
jgi:hypothetical protein